MSSSGSGKKRLDPRRASANSALLPGSESTRFEKEKASSQTRRLCLVCCVFAILLAGASGLAVYILTRHEEAATGVKARIIPAAVHRGTPGGGNVGWISPASYLGDSVNITTYPIWAAATVADLTGGESIFANHSLDYHWGYFSGTDEQRASDVNDMFARKDIHLIISNRGGWGCDRILDLLDYDSIIANPKPIMGYSDLTALLNAIHVKTGLITYHGPMGVDSWTSGVNTRFINNMLIAGKAGLEYINLSPYTTTTISAGQATGKLYGGNLSVFVSLMGSQYFPDLQGAILFLEEITESPAHIDRYMAQLMLAGHLKRIAGFVFGQCTQCDPDPSKEGFTWQEVISQYISPLGIPAFHGSMFGHHLEQQFVLPIGMNAHIDTAKGSITILEAAVKTT